MLAGIRGSSITTTRSDRFPAPADDVRGHVHPMPYSPARGAGPGIPDRTDFSLTLNRLVLGDNLYGMNDLPIASSQIGIKG